MMRPLAGQRVGDQQDTEARLIARAKAGDAAAFERLSGAYADRLFMLLLRLLGDRGEAEDVAQEVMLRAWRAIGSFKGRSSYFTWLYRIAVNEANRALERRARRPASVPIEPDTLQLPAGEQRRAREPGGDPRAARGPRPRPGRTAARPANRRGAARCRGALHPGRGGRRRREPGRVQEPAAPGQAARSRRSGRRRAGRQRRLKQTRGWLSGGAGAVRGGASRVVVAGVIDCIECPPVLGGGQFGRRQR